MNQISNPQPGLYLITGGVCNTYLLTGERLTVIDPGSYRAAELAADLIREILKSNGSNLPIDITCTHFHLDHQNGVDHLRKLTGASVFLSDRAKQFLNGKRMPIPLPHRILRLLPIRKQMDHVIPRWENIRHSRDEARPSLFWPRIKTEVSSWIPDDGFLPGRNDWKMLASPGHSPDSVCFYNLRDKTLVTGDTIFNLDSHPWFHPFIQDKMSARETFRRLKALEVSAFYPGHGQPVQGGNLMEKAIGPRSRN
ncbi:MAG: MBL fold metallo-hydrolase [bacterium]|nr:MBL fold metallo-hydrolase [bacterium]